MRKQKRAEKGKRKQISHQKKRPMEQTNTKVDNKRQKTETKPSAEKKQTVEKKQPVEKKPVVEKKEKSSAEAMKRLSKSNPGLYKLLQSDNLLEGGAVNDDDFAEDDRDIAYWEKKLGLNKKKSKKLGKDFEEDGLLDVLGNLGGENEDGDEDDDDMEYLRKKRQRQSDKKKSDSLEEDAEKVHD